MTQTQRPSAGLNPPPTSTNLPRIHWYASHWLMLVLGLLLIIGIGVGLAFTSSRLATVERVLPRVSVAGVTLGGMTKAQATEAIQGRVNTYLDEEYKFTSVGSETTFTARPSELGVTVDVLGSVQAAYQMGHDQHPVLNLIGQALAAVAPAQLHAEAFVDGAVFDSFADTAFLEIEDPAIDARLAYHAEDGTLTTLASEPGREVDRAPIQAALTELVDQLETGSLRLDLVTAQPDVMEDDLGPVTELATRMLSSELYVYRDEHTFVVPKATLGNWFEFHTVEPDDVLGGAACACGLPNEVRGEDNDSGLRVPAMLITPFEQARRGQTETDPYYVLLPPENFINRDLSGPIGVVGINRDAVTHWLLNNPAAAIDVPGQDARLAFSNDTVTVTQPSKPGIGIDVEQAVRDILFEVASSEAAEQKRADVRLELQPTKPTITEDKISELGINTLIGRGVSDFSGSPPNRIHNIETGFAKYHGLVIAPDQEFSVVEQLGPVDAASGFLPELVIVGKKIRPEYGGGLCQVSSTIFRAALDTGLEITDRTNHSFAVDYYLWPHPAQGVEATIYDPAPDLKFINDTDAHILIQAYVTDDQLAVVEFYGSDPGRSTTIEGPWWVSGGPVGGGTTVFNYIVTDDETGEPVRQQEFVSVFQPLEQFKHEN